MSNIVIYGIGKTGRALAKMLSKERMWLFDDDPTKGGVGLKEIPLDAVDYVLVSPGVRPTAPFLALCRELGIRTVGELAFCKDRCRAKMISVTGTNGKTTVTQLIHYILTQQGMSSYLLGNGGVPLAEKADTLTEKDIVVLEASSFQLCDCENFRPDVSVLTNLHLDHLDHHGSYDAYVEAKCNNFLWQKPDKKAVFNADDHNVVQVSARARCKKFFYSVDRECDCFFDGDDIVLKGQNKRVAMAADLPRHMKSDIAAAVLASTLIGADFQRAAESARRFTPARHRTEYIGTLGKVRFVDDSKGTNLHATAAAVDSVRGNVALILGGSDKGYCFDSLFPHFKNVLYIAAIGQTADKILSAARNFNFSPAERCNDLPDAVKKCFLHLKDVGGTVLLSPACASFDMYDGYRSRGEHFAEIYRALCQKYDTI